MVHPLFKRFLEYTFRGQLIICSFKRWNSFTHLFN